MSDYKIKREAENNRTVQILSYLIENELLNDIGNVIDIISCFPTDVPMLIKELQNSNGVDNDEPIEMLEIHYDISYCEECNVVQEEGDCYNNNCCWSVNFDDNRAQE